LLGGALGPGQRGSPGEEGGPRHRRDPRDVEIGDAAPVQEHRHQPARDVQGLAQRHGPLRPHQELLDSRPLIQEQLLHHPRIHRLEALGLLEAERDHEGHPTQVGLALGEVQRRRDRHPDAAAGDARPILGLDLWPPGHGDECRLGEASVHPLDLGVAEHVLVASEHPAGDGMPELVALPKDGELLAAQHAVLGGQVEVHPVAVHGDHQAFHRREGVDDLLDEEAERGPDLIGLSRLPRPAEQRDDQQKGGCQSPWPPH
jgi:hypothetical protein